MFQPIKLFKEITNLVINCVMTQTSDDINDKTDKLSITTLFFSSTTLYKSRRPIQTIGIRQSFSNKQSNPFTKPIPVEFSLKEDPILQRALLSLSQKKICVGVVEQKQLKSALELLGITECFDNIVYCESNENIGEIIKKYCKNPFEAVWFDTDVHVLQIVKHYGVIGVKVGDGMMMRDGNILQIPSLHAIHETLPQLIGKIKFVI